MLRILVATTDNEPGVLDRVASTFRRRGLNIHSLTTCPTQDPALSRMTILLDLDGRGVRSAKAYLERLVNVHAVADLTEGSPLVRDLLLARVRATPEARSPLLQLAQLFRAEVLDVTPEDLVLSASGSPGHVDALLEALKPYGLLEAGRTGSVAMGRGACLQQPLHLSVPPLAAPGEDRAASF